MTIKLLLIVDNLHQGGAQKSAINFAMAFSRIGYVVTVLILDSADTDFFTIPSDCKIVRVPLKFPNRGFEFRKSQPLKFIKMGYFALSDLWKIQKTLKNICADINMAIESHVGVIAGAVTPKGKPLIISERVHPQFHPVVPPLSYLQSVVYRRKNVYLHAQGSVISNWITERYGKIPKTIPNAIPKPVQSLGNYESRVVLSLGRYGWQKGTDMLLEAWCSIPLTIRKGWRLEYYGSGDRDRYIHMLSDLHIADSVSLNLASVDTDRLMQSASIFVLASRYEGFPNALAEAMARGIPCLTTDNPSAVRDLTQDGKLASLVKMDSHSLAEGLIELITSADERKRLSKRGKQVLEIFSEEKITRQWHEYFLHVLREHN
jgi:GalNAc-alpha-(1->4)-GalNAc-alpha-(1->3)-diNAcBac-PP-undecaprenol alpha-1,4-N-acetyl-D-galactosaminyltransferase